MMSPISPSSSSASSNGERVRISLLKVIDFAPNCYAEKKEFSTVKRDVIIVHSSQCPNSDIGTGVMAADSWRVTEQHRSFDEASEPRRRTV
jgi:hypothetical protein